MKSEFATLPVHHHAHPRGKPPWLQNRSSSFQSCKTFSAGWGLSAFQSSNGGVNQIRNRETNKKLPVKHKVFLNKQEIMLGSHYSTLFSRILVYFEVFLANNCVFFHLSMSSLQNS